MSHLSLHVILAFYGTLFAIGLNPDNCLAIHAGPVGAAKVHFTARWHPLLGQRSF